MFQNLLNEFIVIYETPTEFKPREKMWQNIEELIEILLVNNNVSDLITL